VRKKAPLHRTVSNQDHYLRCTVTKQYADNCCVAYTNTLILISNENEKEKEKEKEKKKNRLAAKNREKEIVPTCSFSSFLSISITS